MIYGSEMPLPSEIHKINKPLSNKFSQSLIDNRKEFCGLNTTLDKNRVHDYYPID